ncbi:MAG: hypothetical protein ACOC8F_05820 [Planctomycetota bacterium]
MTPRAVTALLAVVGAAAGGGCRGLDLSGPDESQTAGQLVELREQLAELRETNRGLQQDLVAKRKRIDTLMGLGDKRLEKLFHVADIKLGRYTGGVDTDGEPGHDAIKVYLRPMDADGSTIKAAGEVTIRLYDLAMPESEELLAVYTWPVEKLSQQWSSGFMTYHFSFVCPWKTRPRHDEITVRVEFVDYLTGEHFTAQKLCKVDLPPADGGE